MSWVGRTFGEIVTGFRDGVRVIADRMNLGYAIALAALLVWFVSR